MMTPLEIGLNHVVPGVGVVIAIATFASPLTAVIRADRTKQLKGLNPLPYPAMAANCTLGCIYGQITRDYYIYTGNLVGLMLSWYFIFTTYKLLTSKDQGRVTVVSLAAAAVLLVVGSVNLFQVVETQLLWGSTAVAVLGIYYSAPLSSLFKVLRERDSSSIYWPLSLTNLTCATLWFVYGMARKDYYFIALPNAMGVAFNTLSLMLCILLPARERQQADLGLDKTSLASTSSSMMRTLLPSFLRGSSVQSAPSSGAVSEAAAEPSSPGAAASSVDGCCAPQRHPHAG